MSEFPYPSETIDNILGLILRPGWLNCHAYLIKPEYFGEVERPFVRGILDHFETYKTTPNSGDLALLAPDFPEERREKVVGLSAKKLEMTHDVVCQFARTQALKLAILSGSRLLEDGKNPEGLEKLVRDALKVGTEEEDVGIEVIEDAHKYLRPTFMTGLVPTGWRHVDSLIKGGLAEKELGLVMGPAGSGKSASLVNIGAAVAGPQCGKNVIHFTLEMSAEDVAIRYATRVSQKEFDPNDDVEIYLKRLGHWGEAMLPGRVLVKYYPTKSASITMLRSFVEARIEEGFDPGLIIVDYPDLMKPPNFRQERRHEISDTVEALRGLAGYFNLPIWGATQSNRGSFNKEIITMADIAEDISKAQIADVIIAFCQTKDERAENEARLFMAKVRKGEAMGQVKIQSRFDLMNLSSIGMVEAKVEEEEDNDDSRILSVDEARAAVAAAKEPKDEPIDNGKITGRRIAPEAVRGPVHSA